MVHKNSLGAFACHRHGISLSILLSCLKRLRCKQKNRNCVNIIVSVRFCRPLVVAMCIWYIFRMVEVNFVFHFTITSERELRSALNFCNLFVSYHSHSVVLSFCLILTKSQDFWLGELFLTFCVSACYSFDSNFNLVHLCKNVQADEIALLLPYCLCMTNKIECSHFTFPDKKWFFLLLKLLHKWKIPYFYCMKIYSKGHQVLHIIQFQRELKENGTIIRFFWLHSPPPPSLWMEISFAFFIRSLCQDILWIFELNFHFNAFDCAIHPCRLTQNLAEYYYSNNK